jgi:hypothetical protein
MALRISMIIMGEEHRRKTIGAAVFSVTGGR